MIYRINILGQELNTTKFVSSLNFNMMSGILDAWLFEIFCHLLFKCKQFSKTECRYAWMLIQFPWQVTCVEFLHFLIF